jgi:hypothetical protein
MNNEITYTQVNDYLIPDIALSDPPDAEPLGYFGMRHKAYLRTNRPILYNQLLLTERLFPLLRQIDEAANERLALAKNSDKFTKSVILQGVMDELVYS